VRALAALLLAAAAAFPAAGCASETPPPPPRQPYKVVLLPVEGAASALAVPSERTADGEGEIVPLALTPEQLETAIFEGIRASNAFTELVAVPADVAAATRAADDLTAAADFARRTNSDLLLRVTVQRARIRDLGRNDATFWSSLAWFMIPAPIWFVDDRTYETDISVEAELFEPRDVAKPTARVDADSTRHELDLWDRGISTYVILVPPPWIVGDPKKVSEVVTQRAVGELMDKLVEGLRTREIPSRFDVVLTAAAGEVRVEVAGRRALRSLEVFVRGKRQESWAETDLVPEKDSTEDRRVYRRVVKLAPDAPGAAGAGEATVRVVAEDEAGSREVRTIVAGREP
jgi:hypothetical protein